MTWAHSADDATFRDAHGALTKAIEEARDYHTAAADDEEAGAGVGASGGGGVGAILPDSSPPGGEDGRHPPFSPV